jgi:type I restriction enzyme S subunit
MMNYQNVKKYPAYKDSGVEWIGEIPVGWKLKKMKYLFRDISIKNRPDEILLSVTQDQGVIPRGWLVNRPVMPTGNLETFKFIEKGNFAISLRSFEGGIEYCHHNGIISPAYTVLQINRELFELYYKYLFKSFSFISEIQTSVMGIREGKNISYPILSYSLLPIPPLPEQTAIANFLDEKCSKIDRAVAQKEKLVALLKERKQIVIQNAVTKGLNPNAKMKDSGVEWIGEIPEGWEVNKVKNLFKLIMDASKKNNDYELLSIYTDIGVKPRKELEERGNKATNTDGYWVVKKGDFIVNKLLAWMGAIGLSEYEGVTSPAYDIIRPVKSAFGYYYHYLFRIRKCSSELKKSSRGIMEMRLRLYFDKFGIVIVPYPPLSEQKTIVAHIETQSQKINKAITLQQNQIEKLKEYKSILINNAVTGKIKVC